MSTRCNVIIKERSGKFFQLYHHHDGYPEGVGADLEDYIEQMGNDCLVDGKKFSDFLCDPKRDDEYEYEGTNICPHGDIEYLYIVDLQKREITCFWVKLFTSNVIEMRKCIKNDSLDKLDFLNIEYTHKFKPKQPKFDPKTLQPFDKVLARLEDYGIWYCEWLSFIEKGTNLFKCCGAYYKYCIPYNDDTKHLVGTTDDAPEFYRFWED